MFSIDCASNHSTHKNSAFLHAVLLSIILLIMHWQEYVGDPNAEHMTVEMVEYVKELGMRD